MTKPFKFEGKRRSTLASDGILSLRSSVDTMIVVDNEKLMNVVQSTDKNLTLDGAFRLTDEILGNAVRSICDIMFRHGLIHVDFADIRTVMTNGGSALMGTGIAEGENRGIRATDMALSSPLLEDINVDGATGVLVNVSHGENFSMLEYNEAMEHIHEAVSDKNDPNIIMGDILLPELGDKVCITIIATGCGGSVKPEVAPMFSAGSFTAPAQPTKASDLVNTLGAPATAAAAPAAPAAAPVAPAPQPVAATPRPTEFNFAALAHRTIAMPSVAPEARTVPMSVMPEEQGYASSKFNAQAPVEEEIITTSASLRETEEVAAVADMDVLSTGACDIPTLQHLPMTDPSMAAVQPEPRNLKYPENSLKTNGVDYDVPAYLRMGDNDLF